jgi:hypothetical protein
MDHQGKTESLGHEDVPTEKFFLEVPGLHRMMEVHSGFSHRHHTRLQEKIDYAVDIFIIFNRQFTRMYSSSCKYSGKGTGKESRGPAVLQCGTWNQESCYAGPLSGTENALDILTESFVA